MHSDGAIMHSPSARALCCLCIIAPSSCTLKDLRYARLVINITYLASTQLIHSTRLTYFIHWCIQYSQWWHANQKFIGQFLNFIFGNVKNFQITKSSVEVRNSRNLISPQIKVFQVGKWSLTIDAVHTLWHGCQLIVTEVESQQVAQSWQRRNFRNLSPNKYKSKRREKMLGCYDGYIAFS